MVQQLQYTEWEQYSTKRKDIICFVLTMSRKLCSNQALLQISHFLIHGIVKPSFKITGSIVGVRYNCKTGAER